MQKKKIPLRKCTGCGEMKPKKELVRVVKTPDDEVLIDLTGRINGRGAYICPNAQCLKIARKSKRIEKSFQMQIPDEVYDKMEEEQMELLEKQKQDTIAILQQAKVAQKIIDEINQTDLENYRKPYRDKILEYIEEENVKRLIQSVSSFNIDDLASMAESLISITNLQRHITSAEESVGGPVDVAVITRSEGFTWIKRKNTLSADY